MGQWTTLDAIAAWSEKMPIWNTLMFMAFVLSIFHYNFIFAFSTEQMKVLKIYFWRSSRPFYLRRQIPNKLMIFQRQFFVMIQIWVELWTLYYQRMQMMQWLRKQVARYFCFQIYCLVSLFIFRLDLKLLWSCIEQTKINLVWCVKMTFKDFIFAHSGRKFIYPI